MFNRVIVSLGFLMATISGLDLALPKASANNPYSPPQPIERQEKNFGSGQEYQPPTSRFRRRPDYREEEVLKKEADAEAQRQAVQNASNAHAQAVSDYKQKQGQAVAANNKGVALGKQGQWVAGIEAHELAVQLEPTNKQYRINLSAARTAYGQERLKAGDLNAAASLFRKALSAASDNGLAGQLLTQTMKRQGRDPNNANVRISTGDQLVAIADFEGATIEYLAAIQIEPSAAAYQKMGDMALRYGQVSTATNWYQQALAKDADFGAAHRQLGLLSLAAKDNTTAAAFLRKAIINDPNDTIAGQALVDLWRRQVSQNPSAIENHLGLAGALQLTGDFQNAENEYQRVETIDPRNPTLVTGRASLGRAIQHAKAERHRLAAETFFFQGLKREALSEISQAVMLEPRNAKYQFILGESLEANRDFQAAHQAYLTAVLLDPKNNQEAAARMKLIQSGGVNVQKNEAATNNIPAQNAPVQNVPAQNTAVQNIAVPNTAIQNTAVQNASPAINNPANTAVNLAATPNAGINVIAAPNKAAVANNANSNMQNVPAAAPAAPSANSNNSLNDALAQLATLENAKNYTAAISTLRQLLLNNLNSGDIHHRLAVNLLANGEIDESIAEFRIASALNPERKDFTVDLQNALSIHKRSLEDPDQSAPNSVAESKGVQAR